MTQLCRACKKPVRFVSSLKSNITWTQEIDSSQPHRCQEYLDNLNNKVKGYFLPGSWSYAPKTVTEQIKFRNHIKTEYRNTKYEVR